MAKTTSKQPRFNITKTGGLYFYRWWRSALENQPEYAFDTRKLDTWISEIWHMEPHLAGVLHTVISLDANRGWTLEGGRNQVNRFSQILHNFEVAPGLKGWRSGIQALSLAFHTSNLGGLAEVGRDTKGGVVQGLFHLDPTRCTITGMSEAPLEYHPSDGDSQLWEYEDFIRLVNMPSILEQMHGIGFCSVNRVIELTKLMVAIYEHDREELGAQAPRGLLLLQGIDMEQWLGAMETREAALEGRELEYFNAVAVLASSGLEQVDAKLIALSSLPKGFDLQTFTSLLMYGYALCFGYDPSEFYPVQFGALGRGTEMEIQHEKATGKGVLNFILSLQEQLQREDILPASIHFEFEQRDEEAAKEEAEAQLAWVTLYATIRQSGTSIAGIGDITREEMRMLLAEKNIIPKDWTITEEDTIATDETPQEKVMLARNKRNLRDELMSKPHILHTIDRFPEDDLIKYSWPTPRIQVVWRRAETLLNRITFPAVQRATVLYKSDAVTITQADVDRAIENTKKELPAFGALISNTSDQWVWDNDTGTYINTGNNHRMKLDQLLSISGGMITFYKNQTRSTRDIKRQTLNWRQILKDEYIRQYLAGIGGIENMTQKDWGSIGGQLSNQYRYLDKLLADTEISERQLQARLRSFLTSSRQSLARARGFRILTLGFDKVRWNLTHGANHCDICMARAAEHESEIGPRGGFVWNGEEVFPGDGTSDCFGNDKCFLSYFNSETGEEFDYA